MMRIGGRAMEWVWGVGVLGAYIAVMRWVLPRFGVRT
jgi:hypothetical protein